MIIYCDPLPVSASHDGNGLGYVFTSTRIIKG